METPRLLIAGEEVRLSEGTTVAVTIAVDTLEGSEINASYTNSFAVNLALANNKRIMGAINSQDAKGYEYNPPRADLYGADGTLLLSQGLAIVNRTEREVAAVNLIDGAGTLFDLLGSDTLQMFDPESMGASHLRNEANASANMANDYTDGFTYTPIDYGDGAVTDFVVDRLWPAVYFYRILKLIIERAGYTLDETDGLPTDGEIFRKAVMPFAGTRHNLQNYFGSDIMLITGGIVVGTAWQTYDLADEITISNRDFVDGVYTVSDRRRAMIFRSDVIVNMVYGLDGVPINQTLQAEVRIRNLTQGVDYEFDSYNQYYSGPAVIGDSFYVWETFLASDPIYTLEVGDQIALQVRVIQAIVAVEGVTTFTNNDDYPVVGAFYNYYTQPIAVTTSGRPAKNIYPALLMPDMLCRDWLKAVLTMFLCRLDIDEVTKVVSVRFFDNYANQTAEDWSGKIDTFGQCTQEFKFGRWAQANTFFYLQEEGAQDSILGNSQFLISNTQLPTEYKVITLPFASTENSVSGIPLLDILTPLTSGNPLQRTLKPRVLLVYSVGGAVDVGATTVTPYNKPQFDGLDWQSLLADYWPALIPAVSQMQRVIIDMRVTAADMEMLDLFKPKYLFYNDGRTTFAGIYLLTKVDEYKGNGRARCEFVNLNRNL
jgi:hypothetical protein